MKQTPTFEELTAQLEKQDAELASLTELVESLPPDTCLPDDVLRALEEATEPPTFASSTTIQLPSFALRA